MSWGRLSGCLVAVALLAGLPPGAWGVEAAGQDGPADAQGADPGEAPAAPEPEGPGAAAEEQAQVGSGATGEADPEADADLPGLLTFETDAACYVYVDGELEGRVEPEAPLEARVGLGELQIRATAIDVVGAVWEKTIELEEPGDQTVRIRMNRAIRLWRREERERAVFRDPKSRLMWAKKDNGLDVDLRQAYAYCGAMKVGGFDDWRLPVLGELKTLESIWEIGAYKIRGGILLSECCMWSSEYDGSTRAWTFNFRFRKAFQTNAGYAIGLRALCVREWSPEGEAEKEGVEAPDEGSGSEPGG